MKVYNHTNLPFNPSEVIRRSDIENIESISITTNEYYGPIVTISRKNVCPMSFRYSSVQLGILLSDRQEVEDGIKYRTAICI